MHVEENWTRIKNHRNRFNDLEIQGMAEALYQGQEDWLAEKLRLREDGVLALEFLGCLGKSGSAKAIAVLIQYLEGGDKALQAAAAEALKSCPSILVLEPLVQIMSRQWQGSIKAGEVLLRLGREGTDALWQLWFGHNKPASLKAQLLQLLSEVRDQRAVSLAFLAFLSDDEELIREALRAAEKLEAKELWGNVSGCLRHPSWRLRGKAVQILGRWGEVRALAYLHDMGADADPWVEEERQKAMALLKERKTEI